MVTQQTLGLFALLIFACLTTLQAQSQLHVRNGCNYYGKETETDYYQFEPNSEARQIVNELLQGSGLSGSSFRLKESNCANALATTVDGVRYILYNPDFLRKFKQDVNTKWAAYGVLAHEIGHHLNGHILSETSPSVRKTYELEADKFAGNLLFHLHATVDEAQAGIKTIPLEGESNTHPAKSARLVATTNGWTAAYDLSQGIQPKVVEQVTVDNEKLARDWFYKGLLKQNSSNYAEAVADYDQAIRLNPTYAKAFYYRGSAKHALNQYNQAIVDYDQAIRLFPNDAVALTARGNLKSSLGKHNEAFADYAEAIRLEPNYAFAFYSRGVTKSDLGQYTEAVADYSQVIKLDSQFSEAYASKGCCLVKMNDKSRMREAIDLINKGLSLDSNMSWAKDCKAEALKKLKE